MRPAVPYWTIPALASSCDGGWNLHPDCIVAYIQSGQLHAETREHDGIEQLVIGSEEKARFEGAADAPMNAKREGSLLRIIGALAITYSGGNPADVEQPYTLAGDLERTAANYKLQWPCGDDTTAAAIRDGVNLLRESGHYAPKPTAERKAA